jgi:hypothetical protein
LPRTSALSVVDAPFEAGCGDGTPFSSEGTAAIGFSRRAESLEAAIRSAIADVQKTGCAVDSVKIEAETLAARP